MIHLPIDFDQGDVRWPVKHKSAPQLELEGQRVLVPCQVFAQEGEECYAGIVKHVDKGACVFFPIDSKKVSFPLSLVRKWLILNDACGATAWERLVPEGAPDEWPADVLFCSFPLQHGLNQGLLKQLCASSGRMAGVEIRKVPPDHRCHGSRFDRGLYATAPFKTGKILGQCELLTTPRVNFS